MTRIAALAAVAALAVVAHADPLPVVVHAGDANLEPDAPHSGLVLVASLGGTTIIGLDSTGDVGRGVGGSLRLGMAATPDTVVTVELNLGSMLHDHMSGSGMETLFENNSTDLLLGGQHYIAPSLWVRGAGGVGVYTRRGVFDPAGAPDPNSSHVGPAGLLGIGLDLLRRHKFVLGLEAFTSLIIESTGAVTTTGVALSVGYQ